MSFNIVEQASDNLMAYKALNFYPNNSQNSANSFYKSGDYYQLNSNDYETFLKQSNQYIALQKIRVKINTLHS